MPATLYQFGGYANNENWYLIRPSRNGVFPGIIFLHGAGGEEQALEPRWSPNASSLMWWMAERGYTVFAPDCSTSVQTDGSHTWGNDGSTTTLDNAITYALANPSIFQMGGNKVILCGTSMGLITATNYVRRFGTSRVAALLAVQGATDVDYHYANGFSANIDAAYGGSWATNGKPSNHSPKDFASTLTLPLLYHYATDDATVPAAARDTFLASYGGPLTSVAIGTGGHTDAPWANVDRSALLSWARAQRHV